MAAIAARLDENSGELDAEYLLVTDNNPSVAPMGSRLSC